MWVHRGIRPLHANIEISWCIKIVHLIQGKEVHLAQELSPFHTIHPDDQNDNTVNFPGFEEISASLQGQ